MDIFKPTIVTQRNTSNGNPVSIKTTENRPVMKNYNAIVLSYVPDEVYRIVIDGYTEIFNRDEITNDTFYCDYGDGVLYFDPSQDGKVLSIQYYSIGSQLISCERVYYEFDEATGKYITLREVIDKAYLALKAIATLGDAVDIINELEEDIAEGRDTIAKAKDINTELNQTITVATPIKNQLQSDVTEAKKWKDQLKQDVADGKVLQPVLEQTTQEAKDTKVELDNSIANAQDDINTIAFTGNFVFTITPTDWVYNSTEKMWEYTVTHNLASLGLITNCYTVANNELITIGGYAVDNNKFKFQHETNVGIKVVINARYYKPIITGTYDEEVVDARLGKPTLKDKILEFPNTKVITISTWTLNSTSGLYEYTLSHNKNNDNVSFTARNMVTNKFITLGGEVVDKNTIKFSTDENVNTKITIVFANE